MNVLVKYLGIVLGMVAGGFFGFWVGAYVGAVLGCEMYPESNLCGLIGFFLTGPIGAVAGGFGTAYLGSRLRVKK